MDSIFPAILKDPGVNGAVLDFCRSFLPERTFAVRRTAMGRTSAPRRRVAVLSTATRRWSRRGREVLLGKQDLPKSATSPNHR